MTKPTHTLQTYEELQQFFRLLQERAAHHAKNVRYVLHSLRSLVEQYADAPPVCRTYPYARRKRIVTNLLRFTVNGRPVALSWTHRDPGVVKLHEGSEDDAVIATFDNATTAEGACAIFEQIFGEPPRASHFIAHSSAPAGP